MKSILDKDRMIRDQGGHNIKNLAAKNNQIDAENERILAKLKQ